MVKTAKNDSQINIWGKGKRRLQFIDANSLVKIILKNKLLSPGIYNLGSPNNLQIVDIANEIARNFDKKIKINFKLDKKE